MSQQKFKIGELVKLVYGLKGIWMRIYEVVENSDGTYYKLQNVTLNKGKLFSLYHESELTQKPAYQVGQLVHVEYKLYFVREVKKTIPICYTLTSIYGYQDPYYFDESVVEKGTWALLNKRLNRITNINFNLIKKYKNSINFIYMLKHNDFPYHILEKLATSKRRWKVISIFQTLSEEFIEKHKNEVNWNAIASYQRFSKKFAERHIDKLQKYVYHINHNLDLKFKIEVKRIYKPKLKTNSTEDKCMVCFEESKTMTTCKHPLCENCLNEWSKIHYSCPMCRGALKNKFIEKRIIFPKLDEEDLVHRDITFYQSSDDDDDRYYSSSDEEEINDGNLIPATAI